MTSTRTHQTPPNGLPRPGCPTDRPFGRAVLWSTVPVALFWLLDAGFSARPFLDALVPPELGALARRALGAALVLALAAVAQYQWVRGRRAEKSLARRTVEQGTLLREAPVAILFTRHRTIMRGNSYMERMFGWAPEDYLGRSTEILYPDQQAFDAAGKMTREFLGARRRDWIEYELKRKDGSVFPARVRGTWVDPEHPDAGELWMIEDISAEVAVRSAEVAIQQERETFIIELEANLERFNRSERVGRIGNWDYDPDTELVWWSDEMYRLYDVDPGVGAPTLDLVLRLCHPDDRKARADAMGRAVETGEDYSFELRRIRRDGVEVVLHERGAMVPAGPGGRPLFLGTAQDVSEQKHAETALKEAHDSLERRVEERTEELQATLQTLVEGVITIDDRGRIETLNQSAEQLFGYRSAEAAGRNVSLLMPDEVGREHDGYLHRYSETGTAAIIGVGREVLGRRKDGSIFPLRLGVGEMRVGGRRKFVGTVYDITEHKRAETELFAAKEQAEAASAAKSDFLSSMSHELRTPMNAVLGFAQLLKSSQDAPLSDEQTVYVDEILTGGERMMELVNDVLRLDDLVASRAAAEIEDCSVKTLVDTCVEAVAKEADQRGVTVANDLDCDHTVRVRVDPEYFREALHNLLSNALKYNHPGGRVTVDRQMPGNGHLRILVSDTGDGVPEDLRGRVFEPFERLGASVSNIAGTGIGLTVARRLINGMGGEIDFKSTPGEGSTFWIDVPLASSDLT